MHWSWYSVCFLCFPSVHCTIVSIVESISELFHLYPLIFISQGLKVNLPFPLQILTWEIVFLSDLKTFCSSFSPSQGLSSCVARVLIIFFKGWLIYTCSIVFRLSLRYDTGVFIYQGSSTKCQYYEMILLKNVMQSKITNSHPTNFDIITFWIRLAFFYHFKNTPKKASVVNLQTGLLYSKL